MWRVIIIINFINRVPTQANRKKITKSDGTFEYVTIEYADEPNEVGTYINRQTMMGIQGFLNSNIHFNEDGSISQSFTDGSRLIVKFLTNGNIEETLTDKFGNQTIRTTSFEENGDIRTVIS